MVDLYFRSTISVITIALVLVMLSIIVLLITYGGKVQKWGASHCIVHRGGCSHQCAFSHAGWFCSAKRDVGDNSMQVLVCSIAGGAITLTGLGSIFLKKQTARKACIHIISMLFVIQVLVMEILRTAMLTGGVA